MARIDNLKSEEEMHNAKAGQYDLDFFLEDKY